MKKLTISLLIFLLLFSASGLRSFNVLAQDEEPTPTVSEKENPEELDDTLKSLKEKIESTVDELNKKNKHAFKGKISQIKDNSITLISSTDKEFTVTIDETITQFYSSSVEGLEEIEQSDIEKGDTIFVTGPAIDDQISANLVYKQAQYSVIHGSITALDDTKFTIDILTPEKDAYTINIEDDTTQQLMSSKDSTLSKAGFSKYKVGDRIHVVMTEPDEDDNATAIRTLIIPQEYFVSSNEAEPTEAAE